MGARPRRLWLKDHSQLSICIAKMRSQKRTPGKLRTWGLHTESLPHSLGFSDRTAGVSGDGPPSDRPIARQVGSLPLLYKLILVNAAI